MTYKVNIGEAYRAGKYFMGMDDRERLALVIQFLNEEPEVFINQVSSFQRKGHQVDDQESEADDQESERLKMVIRLCEAVIIEDSLGSNTTNKTIPLIKKYREFTGAGLRESKEWVMKNILLRGSIGELQSQIAITRVKIHKMGGGNSR